MPVITLTTDFGIHDHYVAAMKGVVLSIAPDATIVDVTHHVQPQDVLHGAIVLAQTVDWFPDDAVHVAVVDPGVGTSRRILAVRYGRQTIVAPDNGIVSLICRDRQPDAIHAVENPAYRASDVSATFHGRDIIAPAAAHIAAGVSMERLGPTVDSIVTVDWPAPTRSDATTLSGEILYADHFGNLITNISRCDVKEFLARETVPTVWLASHEIGPLRRTYSNVEIGQPIALFGSAGLLEISVRDGSAARTFGLARGASVILRKASDPT